MTYAAPPTVPNPANVTLTATSISNKSATATVTITVGSGPLQSGYYAFAYSGWQIKRQQKRGFWTDLPFREVIAGRFYLDGAGNITNGIEDVYGYSGSSLSVPFTGTYTVGTDHTGSFTLKTDGETATYQMTLDASGQKASYIRWDNAIDNFPQNGAGYFELQNTSAFSIAGSYAFGITINEPGLSVVGRFDVNSTGAIEKGTADAVDRSSGYEKLLLTGSFGSPSSTTGRGTATFSINPAPGAKHGSLSAVYYVVSANKLLLVQTDMAGIGEIEKQPRTYSTALLNAPVILQMSGGTWNYKQAAVVGLLSPDGAGSIGGEVDQNIESTVALEQTCAGRYTVDSSGRTDMRLKFGAATNHLIAYLFGDNQAFVIQTTGSESLYGSFKPQTGGPFTAASIGGVFRGTSPFPILQFSENGTGVYIFDGSGDFTGLNYTNVWNGKSSETLLQGGAPGSYTLASNGRGTVSTLSLPFAFWAISPDEMVWINTVSTRDSLPSLLNFDRVSGGPTRRPD
ncbi:MAG TPA: hypothetical protein VGR47_05270 [Terracidiphilus sp.]|nr:hypothetical protein [Terracidiphilus sp.]